MDPRDLEKLLESFDSFKTAQASELIRQNYQRRQAEEKQKLLATVDGDEFFDRNEVRWAFYHLLARK